jgi:ribosome-associated protein
MMIDEAGRSSLDAVNGTADMMIRITDQLTIPEYELWFTTARSGGPGGQHVNKVNSRVTLWFDVASSPSLSDLQKRRIMTRLATRVNRDGILRVVSQQHRSQTANRDTAIERFMALLREALTEAPTRHKTRVSAAAKRRRLDEKKQRGQIKQQRTQRADLDA